MRLEARTFWALAVLTLGTACGGESVGTRSPPADAALGPVLLEGGRYYTCGIPPDGSLSCWGGEPGGDTFSGTAPGPYTQVAASRTFWCALDEAGQTDCSPVPSFPGPADVLPPSTDPLTRISSGATMCGIRRDGSVVCGGADVLPGVVARNIATGASALCAVTADDAVLCSPPGLLEVVSVATDVLDVFDSFGDIVILHQDGSISTWPAGEIHAGPFTYASTASTNAGPFGCGLLRNQTIQCWGATAPPPEGTFLSMSVGMPQVCAIRISGELVCWDVGENGPMVEPPEGFPGL